MIKYLLSICKALFYVEFEGSVVRCTARREDLALLIVNMLVVVVVVVVYLTLVRC